jgi:hypothetical protein
VHSIDDGVDVFAGDVEGGSNDDVVARPSIFRARAWIDKDTILSAQT